jgi:hypothetical protein
MLIGKQYVFPNEGSNNSHILSLLPSEPVNPDLAIGVTNQLPPTPDSLRENPKFLSILQEVFAKHAHEDPDAQSQAQVMVSTAGANLYTGGVLMAKQRGNRRRTETGDSSGGASGQGGAGGAGKGGWIHISDNRRPPEFGRIAWYGTYVISEDKISANLCTGPRISLAVSRWMDMVNSLVVTANIKQVVCCE